MWWNLSRIPVFHFRIVTSPAGPWASRLDILSQLSLPDNHPLLVGTGISELGEQVVVHGTSWKSDNMVPSPRTGEEEQQNTKLQGVCCLIKSVYCVQCYGDATHQAHSWAWGPDVSLESVRAPSPLSSTSSNHFISHMRIWRPRKGEPLARGHTALIQQNIKYLLCQALCLGLGILKSEQNSHKLQFHGVYTWVEEMGKKQVNTWNQRLW